MKILVATRDSLTPRMAGPAIRSWHIAQALAPEHEVRLVTTATCEVSHPLFTVQRATDRDLKELEEWCDVLIFQGFLMRHHPHLMKSDKVIVVDMYDPFHLEQLEQNRTADPLFRLDIILEVVDVLNQQLLRGDFFLCASPKQRDFWLGHLGALGRLNAFVYDEDATLRKLITEVPFGVPDHPPVKTAPAAKGVIPGIDLDDKLILWGGGIYNWLDPITLVYAVDRLRRRMPEVRLLFMGLAHPNPEVPEMLTSVITRDLARRLGLLGKHVFFNPGWVPYEERHNYLLEADIGVSTHLDHAETAFSFRTRILDYIWAGLPIVATQGDSLAQLIDERALGLTVPPNDPEALEAALFQLLDDAELASACRKHLAEVAPTFAWAKVLEPLVQFCRAPRRAPDLVDPKLANELFRPWKAIEARRHGWRREVDTIAHHLRVGGPRQLALKAASRVRHRLAGRR